MVTEDQDRSNSRSTPAWWTYDAVLQHGDIYVLASECGGLSHALANSVPVVQAGLLLDRRTMGAGLTILGWASIWAEARSVLGTC